MRRQDKDDWMTLAGLALMAATAMLLSAVAAHARAPKASDPDLAPWFHDLKSPPPLAISCCDQADGHILADHDWRPAGDGYEVKINGAWEKVPPAAVIERADNPTGGAVVFYPPDNPGWIICFVRPAET